ncbi:response regulator [[Pantoea] beijingensis]|uniref:Response regulator n=1 Tax=[Pantoea] beijingensis TaxID=1324864 RepID=A0A443IBH4_9GAMM|nr:response regulator [[Pantoea] beijingensis]
MNSIFIVDDHPIIAMGVRALLRSHGYNVVSVVDNGLAVIAGVGLHRPDLIIMDLNIPGRDGIQIIESLKRINKDQKIIVLTALESEYHRQRCRQFGVEGFIYKSNEINTLLEAIPKVEQGQYVYPEEKMPPRPGDSLESQRLMSLSKRELSVLIKLASGMSNKEIATQLSLSNKTISTYKVKIMHKLEIKNIVEINEMAKRNCLVQ